MAKKKKSNKIKKAKKQKTAIKKQRKKGKGKEEISDHAYPAKIMEIVGKMGTREGGKQVRVKILAGPDSGKVMRRNVLGPFRVGDVLMLKETEIEASPTKGRKR
ncbi:30S ribosomal protein S28e [Candidatus Woesearchaeota archaeon]|nr:30S ribosomal protein S28e [Candidatus Woesearchaeota archaeon]